MGRFLKRGQVWETLVPWLLALLVLVLVIIYYGILDDKGTGFIGFIKNLVKFR